MDESNDRLSPSVEPRSEAPVERASTPPPTAQPPRKRPRLDLNAEPRKRGKTMFGILVGTLNKAKNEDMQRNKSEAVRRRMSIDNKLLSKLAQEQIEVRRQDEIKKNRALASRKEDDLAIQDSVLRLSQKTKPYLSHFLTTSDTIPLPTSDPPSIPLPFSVPPPVPKQTVLYYLPAVLLPEQEAFLKQRQDAVNAQIEGEQRSWKEERRSGVEEVESLRRRAEELSKAKETEDADAEPAPTATAEAASTPTAEGVNERSLEAVGEPTKLDDDGDAGEEALEY